MTTRAVRKRLSTVARRGQKLVVRTDDPNDGPKISGADFVVAAQLKLVVPFRKAVTIEGKNIFDAFPLNLGLAVARGRQARLDRGGCGVKADLAVVL